MTQLNDQKQHSEGSDFSIGSIVFDRFEILGVIGSGSKGRVYKAQDKILDNTVALKVLITDAKREKDLLRFQSEARLASKMKHRGIATIYDFGLSGSTPFLCMEYVVGESLSRVLEEHGTLPLADFFEIFIQVCEAISHAHKNGIVHRDLKPDNLVISENSDGTIRVKVLDFGVAKSIDIEQDGSLTPTGNLVGSPGYMSPEQAQGNPVSPKSDIYSLGCVMWNCLVGEPPFLSESSMETLWHHSNSPVPKLNEQVIQPVPEKLATLIESMLAKHPEERPQLIDGVLQQLESMQQEIHTAEVEKDAAAKPDTMPGITSPQRFKHMRLLAALFAALFVGVGLITYWVLKSPPPTHRVEYNPAIGKTETQEVTQSLEEILKGHHNGEIKATKEGKRTDLSLRYDHTKADLEALADNTQLMKLDLSDSPIKDSELIYLTKVPNLSEISFNRTALSTLDNLEGVKKLRRVEFKSTMITDDALKHVGMCQNLHDLTLSSCLIGDRGIANISNLRSLHQLDISNTKITDKCIPDLLKLKRLEKLSMRQTKISEIGARRLLEGLPGLQIMDVTLDEKRLNQARADFPLTSFNGATPVIPTLAVDAEKFVKEGNIKEAMIRDQQIIMLLERRFGQNYSQIVPFATSVTHFANKLHEMAVAEVYIDKAIRITEDQHDDGSLLNCLDVKANILDEAGKKKESLAVRERAFKLADQMKPLPILTALRLMTLADHYKDLSQFDKSEKAYLRAISIITEQRGPNAPLRGEAIMHLAECSRDANKIQQALGYYKQSVKILESAETKNNNQTSALYAAYAGWAAVLLKQNKIEESLKLSDKAMDLGRHVAGNVISREQRVVVLLQRSTLMKAIGNTEEEANLKRRAEHLRTAKLQNL